MPPPLPKEMGGIADPPDPELVPPESGYEVEGVLVGLRLAGAEACAWGAPLSPLGRRRPAFIVRGGSSFPDEKDIIFMVPPKYFNLNRLILIRG